MNQPVTLLFDLDGTLVDSAVTIAQALTDLSTARGGGPADVMRVRRLVSGGVETLVRETLGLVAGDSDADIASFRLRLAEIPPQAEMIYPGTIAALAGLRAQGHLCAVVTNKPERLARLLLDQLDLSLFFDAVVGGDTLSVCKPDPAPLRYALAELSADPNSALMIGDSSIDAAAAGAAGMPFLLFEGGYGPMDKHLSGVHISFREFAELSSLVAQCGSFL